MKTLGIVAVGTHMYGALRGHLCDSTDFLFCFVVVATYTVVEVLACWCAKDAGLRTHSAVVLHRKCVHLQIKTTAWSYSVAQLRTNC